MTGQKDRYTTAEKLWKLDDETLTTPKHDEIVLWALDKRNILPCVNFNNDMIKPQLFLKLFDDDGNLQVNSNILGNGGDSLAKNLKNKTHDHEYMNIIETKWDQINKDYDIAISQMNCVFDNWLDFVKIDSETPIIGRNGFMVGYTDIQISMDNFNRTCGLFTIKIPFSQIENNYIEIKPHISSFGQTLRQLRTYQHYLPDGGFYILTTDTKFKKAFESQGIKVLIYPNK